MPGFNAGRDRQKRENSSGKRNRPPQADKNSASPRRRSLTNEDISKLSSLSREDRASAILELQRRYGNQRVQRMLDGFTQSESAESSSDSSTAPVAASKEENEQGGSNQLASSLTNQIEEEKRSGMPLDSKTQDEMESSFGSDFSDVRVHTGSQADQMNREVSAKAFTTDNDIFFRGGKYAPGTSEGKELLAHELTHVVQQGGVSTSGPTRMTSPEDTSEVEAANTAKAIVHQTDVSRQEDDDSASASLARQEEEEPMQGALARQEEEEPMQGAIARQEEEEPMQGAIARQEEDEPMQGAVARQEEEEPMQGAVARQAEDDDSASASLARQEEEEPMQGAVARQEEEEPMQGAIARATEVMDKEAGEQARQAILFALEHAKEMLKHENLEGTIEKLTQSCDVLSESDSGSPDMSAIRERIEAAIDSIVQAPEDLETSESLIEQASSETSSAEFVKA